MGPGLRRGDAGFVTGPSSSHRRHPGAIRDPIRRRLRCAADAEGALACLFTSAGMVRGRAMGPGFRRDDAGLVERVCPTHKANGCVRQPVGLRSLSKSPVPLGTGGTSRRWGFAPRAVVRSKGGALPHRRDRGFWRMAREPGRIPCRIAEPEGLGRAATSRVPSRRPRPAALARQLPAPGGVGKDPTARSIAASPANRRLPRMLWA